MARFRRGKKSLYEVMSKARLKPSYRKTLEPLRPAEPDRDEPTLEKPGPALPTGAAKWWTRSKHVQINAGRIEISVPYQLAIAILLGLIVLILLAFRFGQFSQKAANSSARIRPAQQSNPIGANPDPSTGPEKPAPSKETFVPDKSDLLTDSDANNRIVIQTFQVRSHLEPVREYFAQFGIETEIRKIGDWYYLITKNKYQNPQKQGTDGYLMKQKIMQLGANYKAPPGRETFAPNLFKDAYGIKLDD